MVWETPDIVARLAGRSRVVVWLDHIHRPVKTGNPGHCEELGVAVGFRGERNPCEQRESLRL